VKHENKNISALLYDWHNEYVLEKQNNDIEYFKGCIKEYSPKNILIVGAGTGRVAIPLSSHAELVALDIDKSRLERLTEKNNEIKIIKADICNYKSQKKYDLIIMPYSTLQLIPIKIKLAKCMNNIYNLLSPSGVGIFDVSRSFNTKKSSNWGEKLDMYCRELDERVIELQKIIKGKDKVIIIKKYIKKNNDTLIQIQETWYPINLKTIKSVLLNASLDILKVDNGYLNGKSKHRYIIHVKKQLID